MTESGGLAKNTEGLLYREGHAPAEAEVKKYVSGRDAGDHLIEFVDDDGTVRRQYFVVRPKGTHENGTFEAN